MKNCCFIGHRKIEKSEKLVSTLYEKTKKLIVNEGVTVFLFGSRSEFNDLCYEVVTDIKKEYSAIRREYVRAEYPYIREEYKNYLLESYEETYFPKAAINAGRAVYVKRNCEMIEKSDFCVFYFDTQSVDKSGTKIAFNYAAKKKKQIINAF